MPSDSTAQYWATYLRKNNHPRAADLIERELSIDEAQATMWEDNRDEQRSRPVVQDSEIAEDHVEIDLPARKETIVMDDEIAQSLAEDILRIIDRDDNDDDEEEEEEEEEIPQCVFESGHSWMPIGEMARECRICGHEVEQDDNK